MERKNYKNVGNIKKVVSKLEIRLFLNLDNKCNFFRVNRDIMATGCNFFSKS